MFVILFCFLVTSFIFIILGKSFIIRFDNVKQENYSFFDSFFIGICIAGSLLNIWSLALPTNYASLLFLFFSSTLLLYINFKPLKKEFLGYMKWFYSEKKFFYLIIISLFLVLMYALVLPRNFDTYLYHINAIQWNEMYSVVPGLANFHNRFGLNSSVMTLSAGFSFISIYNQYIFIISSLPFFVFFVWLLKYIYFQKGAIGLFSLFFIYFFFLQYGSDISSPGTDLLPNIFVAFVLLSLIFDPKTIEKKQYIFVIIPFFCFTLKLSVFPILIIGILAIFKNNNTILLSTKKIIALGSIIILPWIIRNVILSGYILYPIENLDFFSFDWKVPKENVIEIKNWIYSWGRIPMKDYHDVLKLSFMEWFPIWWNAALLRNQVFITLAAFAPLNYIVFYFLNKKANHFIIFLTVSITYLSFLLWLFTAPDIRFSFSFILILALFPILIFKDFYNKLKIFFNPSLIILLFLTLFLVSKDGYKLFREEYHSFKNVSKYSYLPNDVYYEKQKRNVEFEKKVYLTPNKYKIDLFCPKITNTQCYDKFPCAPRLDNSFSLRGEGLQEGFVP
jgi:hypothetical protein